MLNPEDRDHLEQVYEGAEPRGDEERLLREVYADLNSGAIRVAEKVDGAWVTNEWVKKAVLLSFRFFDAEVYSDGVTGYFDRLAPRYRGYSAEDFRREGARVIPGAVVRDGAHIAPDVVLMPSFVNVGAWVGEGTMVDTWVTVGSCAQIGRGVHLSGGVGIGGVLEPAQATPTIIEDECFIGARSEVVEGVVVGEGSVLAMGVFISQSTPIYGRSTGESHYGKVPPGSVVVPGTLNRGDYGLSAAIIVKTVDARTRAKTSITELLRGV